MKNITLLIISREIFSPETTLGALFINGEFFCYTLEDAVRGNDIKIPGETAIPTGLYKVEITMSNRFKRLMPLVLDVPGFTGIRFHGGNTHVDTKGCICVAFKKLSDEMIYDSADYLLLEKLKASKYPIYVCIINNVDNKIVF